MSVAFLGIAALALKDGTGPLKELPDQTYRRKFGSWSIELDGKSIRAKVEFNGWPAGIIDPGGGIIAAGEAANEDTFIAAIEAELGMGVEAFYESRAS